MKHPAAVTACNLDLENLITDSNRSIATLAITTLLKVSKLLLRWQWCLPLRSMPALIISSKKILLISYLF